MRELSTAVPREEDGSLTLVMSFHWDNKDCNDADGGVWPSRSIVHTAKRDLRIVSQLIPNGNNQKKSFGREERADCISGAVTPSGLIQSFPIWKRLQSIF